MNLTTIKNYFRRRETRRELSNLTDRELNDIGICRGDIERIVKDI